MPAPFGHADFDITRLAQKPPHRCPVRDCSAALIPVPYGRTKTGPRHLPWCPEHGLRLHARTFAYWNGAGREDVARLRNFIVQPELARAIALGKGMKAEFHRLGNEMSEDALSWNASSSSGGRRKAAGCCRGPDPPGTADGTALVPLGSRGR